MLPGSNSNTVINQLSFNYFVIAESKLNVPAEKKKGSVEKNKIICEYGNRFSKKKRKNSVKKKETAAGIDSDLSPGRN